MCRSLWRGSRSTATPRNNRLAHECRIQRMLSTSLVHGGPIRPPTVQVSGGRSRYSRKRSGHCNAPGQRKRCREQPPTRDIAFGCDRKPEAGRPSCDCVCSSTAGPGRNRARLICPKCLSLVCPMPDKTPAMPLAVRTGGRPRNGPALQIKTVLLESGCAG